MGKGNKAEKKASRAKKATTNGTATNGAAVENEAKTPRRHRRTASEVLTGLLLSGEFAATLKNLDPSIPVLREVAAKLKEANGDGDAHKARIEAIATYCISIGGNLEPQRGPGARRPPNPGETRIYSTQYLKPVKEGGKGASYLRLPVGFLGVSARDPVACSYSADGLEMTLRRATPNEAAAAESVDETSAEETAEAVSA